MKRKKVLVLSPGLPYPPSDGHKLKLYNLVEQIKEQVDVSLVIISNEKISVECEGYLNQTYKSWKIFKFSKFSYLFNLLNSVFHSHIPFQVSYYTFNKVYDYLDKHYKNSDYVIFNLIRMTGYMSVFEKQKIILDLVDSIGINYLKSRKNTSSLLYRIIYSLETKRLLKYEKVSIIKSKISLLVNKSEAHYYKRIGDVLWLPNGVNKHLINIFSTSDKPFICFFGAMFYQPNIDAVVWFSKNVMPKLKSEIKLYIIGGKPSKEVLKLQDTRTIVTGYIDNPYEMLKSAICTVAPMQTGGGIQNKILESMAIGQITITNDLGANPIVGSKNLHNLLIANTPDEFADFINELYAKPENYQGIKTNAKDLIIKSYSWDKYGEELLKILN